MKSLRDCAREERKAYKRWQRAKREERGSTYDPKTDEFLLFFKWKHAALTTLKRFGVWRPRPGARIEYRTNEQTQSVSVGVDFSDGGAP